MSVSLHPLSHRKQLEMMNRDVAQLVSAPALGAGGPPFESEYPDEKRGLIDMIEPLFLYILSNFGGRMDDFSLIVINVCYSGAERAYLPPNRVNCSHFGAEEPVLPPNVNDIL